MLCSCIRVAEQVVGVGGRVLAVGAPLDELYCYKCVSIIDLLDAKHCIFEASSHQVVGSPGRLYTPETHCRSRNVHSIDI